MPRFLPLFRLALARIASNRVLLTTVAIGIVLSSALMSTVILYTDAVRDLGLEHILRGEEQEDVDIRIASSGHPVKLEDYTRRRERTLDLLRGYLGGQLSGIQLAGRSDTLYLSQAGQTPVTDDSRPRSHFQFVSNMADQLTTVSGREFGAAQTDPEVIEAWVAKSTADRLAIKEGDTYDLYPFWRTDNSKVSARVVGIVEPMNEGSTYWRGRHDWFDEDSTRWPTYTFLVSEETFVRELGGLVPDIDGSFETYGLIDRGAINSSNAERVEGGVAAVESIVRGEVERTLYETTLGDTLAEYARRSFFTRVPLFALMIQIVAIVLYYLVMVATMVVERQSGEIALLRGRGATSGQILGMFGVEAALLCLVLGAAGPLIATVGISALGFTPPFEDLSGNDFLKVRLTWQAWALGWAGALIAFAAMMVPAWRATRLTIVEHQRSLARPPLQPLFLKYYLDLVLIAAGALIFYQLRRQDSLVSERLFGGLSADPLLLISPTLFLLMVALVFLRLFPLALRVVSWATRPLPGPTLAMGLWRMTRAPLHYSRLILLLLLATAVGMFAASFRATLDRSYDDRAAFEAGAPARVTDIRGLEALSNDALASRVVDATDSSEGTPVLRMDGSHILGAFTNQSITMLGLVPGEFESIARWRDDFSGRGLENLLADLGEPLEVVKGPNVPAGSTFIGAWVEGELRNTQARLAIRMVDASGRHVEFELGDSGIADAIGRKFYFADVVGRGQQRVAPPERWIEAVFVRILPQDGTARVRATVVIDDMRAFTARPDAEFISRGTAIEGFDAVDKWEWLTGLTQVTADGGLSPAEVPNGGGTGMRINYVRGPGMGVVGARIKASYPSLPILADSKLLEVHRIKVGEEFLISLNTQYLAVKVVGSFDLFPSYYPAEDDRLLVADLRSLQIAANRVPFFGRDLTPNEVWLSGASAPVPGPEEFRKETGISAEQTYDLDGIRAADAADPLVAASWEGILFLSFAAVLALTALGFAVHARVSATSRGLEFAVLRSMGYTTRQVFSLVGFEQLFVVVLGVTSGTALGFPLARLMVGYLSRTETGAEPVPPLISEVSLGAVLTVYASIGVVIVVTIISLAVLYSRIAVSRMLRVGEV